MPKKYKIIASVSTNSSGSNTKEEWELDQGDCEKVELMTKDKRDEWAWENGGENACNEMAEMSVWIEEV